MLQMELCIMLLECCSQERTYLRYYGLLGQRFCMINKIHQENFEKCFVQQYSMIHRLETNKLRNVAKFFAHLLGTDALPWHVLAYIRLTEEDTTSSSRIFIKILFQVTNLNQQHIPRNLCWFGYYLCIDCRNCQSTWGLGCLMRGFRIQQCRSHLNPSSLKIIQRTLGLQSTSLPPLVLEASRRVSESTWRTCHASSCNNRSKLLNQNQDPTVLVPSLILTQIHRHLLLVLMKATERRGSQEEDFKRLYC